jgi:Poly A polymerase head domain/Probable RNA and SrmB- binding site of polymerase A
MREAEAAVRAAVAGDEAYVVGGAVRDELLGRPVVDVDIACPDPIGAARAYAKATGGALFQLSERHGAWRVAYPDGRTVDFTPLPQGLEADLATRDFTVNAIAVPVQGGGPIDPFDGLADLEARSVRVVSPTVFEDDPLRLLRAVRLEGELGFRLEPETEALVRASAHRVTEPAGERILAELARLTPDGFRRLDDLGLLEPLGGTLERLRDASQPLLLVLVFGRELERLPISTDLRRLGRRVLGATAPTDDSPRAIHRFRVATEPFALEALAYLDAEELVPAVEAARAAEPAEPLLRGDELGVGPGPEVGRLLARIAEERAAGTIRTREDALRLVERERVAG